MDDANLARLSLAVYEPRDAAQSFARRLGADETRWLSGGSSTQAMACIYENCVVIAFRGTEPNELADWLADLRAMPVRVMVGTRLAKVHKGFLLAAGEVFEQTLDVARRHAGRPLYLTGHSLGHALALITGAWLSVRGLAPARIVTFGGPRCGNGAFGRLFNGIEIVRYVNCGDIVPRVLWSYYRHVGRLCYVDRHGRLRPTAGCCVRAIDRWISMLQRWDQDGLAVLADHSMAEYLRLLSVGASRTPSADG